MTDDRAPAEPRRLATLAIVGVLAALSLVVMQLFLVPLLWAAIMAWTTWPLYRRLRAGLGGRRTLAAVLMTLGLSAAVVGPLLWLLLSLRTELANAWSAVAAWLAQGPHPLPRSLAAVPMLGEFLQRTLDELSADPHALREHVGGWVERQGGALYDLLGGVGRNVVKLGFSMVTVFFLFRDGEAVLRALRHALRRAVGPRGDAYLHAVGDITHAVVQGLVVSALAQGLIAGLGYAVAGLPAPVMLAVLTTVVAMVPWGTPVVWIPLGGWLLLTGHTAAGVGLLLWGALAVSWIDNLLRPLMISSATHVPFLIVMFGVIGGAAAFGLVGLFVGPVILATGLAVLRQWLEGREAPATSA